MPNANYRKGAEAERGFCRIWEERGFYAFRTAGSHSLVDIILVNKSVPPYIALCQLKRYGNGKPPKPDKEFKDMITPGVSRWWCTRKDRKDWDITYLR